MIKRNKSVYLILCLLLMTCVVLSGCGKKEAVVKESQITVNTAKASKTDIAKSVRYSGIVRGKNEVYIMPKVPARVTAIYVKPGDMVSVGQALLTLDSSDYEAGIQQAAAGKSLADVQLQNAQSNYERTQKLYEAGAASAQQWEVAQRGLDSAQAGIEQAAAGYRMAQDQVGNCSITAPISGVVGSVNLSLGETANTQAPAAIVTNSNDLEIEVMVSESEVTYVQQGSEVEVLIKAVQNEPFTGAVDSISTVADPVKRNYAVKVALPNQEGKIKSGMFAEVSVHTLSRQEAIGVPSTAVIPKGGRDIVYTVDEDSRARLLEVEVGIMNNQMVEILQGIKPGQEVITRGNTLVSDGSLVRVVAGGAK
ncbi:MAG: efflux RND transporter periplasmic adaptor subunit [Bacillota bacterium]|nr:efflux RND transporter periplasmic adaptor subunit [Bacillota bacterium]